jgi:threonine synthase
MAIRYISTRGSAPPLKFSDVLLAGLARDGGLYMPASWPKLSAAQWRALAGKPYPELAQRLLRPFIGDAVKERDLAAMAAESYRGFDHPAVAPLRQNGPNDWLLELFHGPTLAFKDYALQLVGRLFDHELKRRRTRTTIIGATSGDTGSAAIEACRDRDAIDIFILHPHGRVSEVQRRQMTTVAAANVHNIAIEGTFDDCQDLVKAMFNDAAFRDRLHLSAVNSINWARVAAQTVYYASAALALGAPDRKVAFSVPTGNFGNVFAGYAARCMGLPIERFVIGSNRNDILYRLMISGAMKMETVQPTLSPSMDIQVSSNFERMLFELTGRKGKAVAALQERFRAAHELKLTRDQHGKLKALFAAGRASDDETLAMIRKTYETSGVLVDPHTAVGLVAAAQQRDDSKVPMVTIATAHPAKFPDAVEKATGIRPQLPARLGDLMQRQERFTVLPNNLGAVQDFLGRHNRAGA